MGQPQQITCSRKKVDTIFNDMLNDFGTVDDYSIASFDKQGKIHYEAFKKAPSTWRQANLGLKKHY